MADPTLKPYELEILDTTVTRNDGGRNVIRVTYLGREKKQRQVAMTFEGEDVPALLAVGEAVARKIFHAEFRLNSAVDLSFSLADENGMKIWHTAPQLYMKCPLTMSMEWSCEHLRKHYNTFTSLGVIELPDEVALEGNAVGIEETARVIVESMASGIEFMGTIIDMRNTIDHESEVKKAEFEES